MSKFVVGVEKGKPTPISPYLYHLYNQEECISDPEAAMLETARMMLQFDVSPEREAEPEVGDEDSESQEREPTRPTPGAKRKSTYRASTGGTPVRTPQWREVLLSTFEFPDEPFKRIREEIEQLQSQYARLEHITRGAGKLLNDCRPSQVLPELEKLVKKKEVEELKEENTRLSGQVADLTQEVRVKSDEIRRMNSRTRESLERIQSFIGSPGDVVNKARLFDNDIRTGGHPSAPKIIAVLVEFGRKMEATLSDMRGLLSGGATEPFRFPVPVPNRAASMGVDHSPVPAVADQATPSTQRPGKERAESERLETPVSTRQTPDQVEAPSDLTPGPSSRRLSSRYKAREPTPEPSSDSSSESEEELDVMELEESSEEPGSEEAREVMAEASTPPPSRPRIVTRAVDRRRSTSMLKTPSSSKRAAKEQAARRGGSTQKKPRRK